MINSSFYFLTKTPADALKTKGSRRRMQGCNGSQRMKLKLHLTSAFPSRLIVWAVQHHSATALSANGKHTDVQRWRGGSEWWGGWWRWNIRNGRVCDMCVCGNNFNNLKSWPMTFGSKQQQGWLWKPLLPYTSYNYSQERNRRFPLAWN